MTRRDTYGVVEYAVTEEICDEWPVLIGEFVARLLSAVGTDYSHTSVAPKWPVPKLSAQAIGKRLGRSPTRPAVNSSA